MRYLISEKANQDIEKIWLYTFENKKGYRASLMKSHIIFYKKSKSNTVEIIRVLHQRMDIENQIDK